MRAYFSPIGQHLELRSLLELSVPLCLESKQFESQALLLGTSVPHMGFIWLFLYPFFCSEGFPERLPGVE